MSEHNAVWGKWDEIGDQDGTQQRYIETIEVDGVVWRGDGGDMVGPLGRRANNAGRGEVINSRGETYTVYALDGVDVDGNPDAEDSCAEAIRDGLHTSETAE